MDPKSATGINGHGRASDLNTHKKSQVAGEDDPLKEQKTSDRDPLARRHSIVHKFEVPVSKHVLRLRQARDKEGTYGTNLQILYLGIAILENDNGSMSIGYAAHDGTYTIDFHVETIQGVRDVAGGSDVDRTARLSMQLAQHITNTVRNYSMEHLYKFAGAGLTPHLVRLSPELSAMLWSELDIVGIKLVTVGGAESKEKEWAVDEVADSMSRKLLSYFGPTLQPRLLVGYRNEVGVDVGGRVDLTNVQSYERTTSSVGTWQACMEYCQRLVARKVKIAFMSSTPQGGGVALMRHALIRFFREVGVDIKWYVPRPKPEVFRITKTNHNILQGVADPKARLSSEQIQVLDEWCEVNAKRMWMEAGGPLASRKDGGADIIVVDDPQMPRLVKLAKGVDPERPVIWRSHIQVRADLVDQGDNPTSEVWDWIWENVKEADLVVSHPVREFVPKMIPVEKVAYMPATTDWLDGLNKDISPYDMQYYTNEFNTECFKMHQPQLAFPARDYIVQIARFDPAKGIPDVLESYAKLRRGYMKDASEIPQLVLAGHAAIDDPDASLIYEQTMEALDKIYADIKNDIIVMRLGPTDQILNTLISQAKVALQLSTREGFEVKVSEALHKGTPVIATRAGGIPLQIEDRKSGFVVEVGDTDAVAKHLHVLLTDGQMYMSMSDYAAKHVSDEVSTVGNALCWAYLTERMTSGEVVRPCSAWVSDLAREGVGLAYADGENRLRRVRELDLTRG